MVLPRGFERPLDYNGARSDWMVVRTDDREIFYLNVESGEKIFLTDLTTTSAIWLTRVCDVFSFFV